MIAFRFLSIAARRYSAEPDGRNAAARMMLANALRIAKAHLGAKEAARVALETLTEDERGRACS
jgi:hypothetical protein